MFKSHSKQANTRCLSPETITDRDAKPLFDFFESQAKKGKKIWRGDRPYFFQDQTSFCFQTTVIQRARKEGKEGVRYEFIGTKVIGKGTRAKLFQIDATIAVNEEHITIKRYGAMQQKPSALEPRRKNRLVKIEKHLDADTLSRVGIEYQLSLKAGHLAIKPPTIIGKTSYLVMRQCTGRELFEVIENDLNQKIVLSMEQRLSISSALLMALKTQVTDKKIIHRDLKGENIIIDLDQHHPLVNIIDFGLSVAIDQPDDMHPGSLCFAPPEVFDGGPQTLRLDVFSMGRMIALLWHVSLDSYNITNKIAAKANAHAVNLDSLFLGLKDIGVDEKSLIKTTLQAMVHQDPAKRISIEEAIEAFAAVTLLGSSVVSQPSPRPVVSAPLCIQKVSSLGLFASSSPHLTNTSDDLEQCDQMSRACSIK